LGRSLRRGQQDSARNAARPRRELAKSWVGRWPFGRLEGVEPAHRGIAARSTAGRPVPSAPLRDGQPDRESVCRAAAVGGKGRPPAEPEVAGLPGGRQLHAGVLRPARCSRRYRET